MFIKLLCHTFIDHINMRFAKIVIFIKDSNDRTKLLGKLIKNNESYLKFLVLEYRNLPHPLTFG